MCLERAYCRHQLSHNKSNAEQVCDDVEAMVGACACRGWVGGYPLNTMYTGFPLQLAVHHGTLDLPRDTPPTADHHS